MTISSGLLPRHMRVGRVLLDLLYRDARIGDRWLHLHPREFHLLWRLAEMPRMRVSRKALLRDVWRLGHDPQTNTLEVHVHRLRQRLAPFGLDTMIATDPQGGYRLEADVAVGPPQSADGQTNGLDSHVRIGDDMPKDTDLGGDHGISGERTRIG